MIPTAGMQLGAECPEHQSKPTPARIPRGRILRLVLPVALAGTAVVLAIWVNMPWPTVAALGLLTAETVSTARHGRVSPWGWALAWSATLLLPANLLLTPDRGYILDPWAVALAWLMASALFLAGVGLSETGARVRWGKLVMAWSFLGGGLLLGCAYGRNLAVVFYPGLALNVALLVLCKRLFQIKWLGIQVANTLILVLVGLPLFDLLIRPAYHRQTIYRPEQRLYAYEAARKDPGGFQAYLAYARQQWKRAEHGLFMPDPDNALPWRLRPNTKLMFHQSLISINSRGFRGREIAAEKGRAYRIVALGESTTFGVTLYPEDRPWPELLEQLIRDRLKPDRPVEVINAGVPALNLEHNLHRLPRDILPLHPDLIISYHGFNGFSLIDEALPEASVRNPPEYENRPVKLLADAEFRIKVLLFNHHRTAELLRHPPTYANPMTCRYAQAYERLARAAETNRIRLALATYSMAVNGRSDAAVIDFYRGCFPAVHWQIEANAVHSAIVREVAREHPSVCLVDTQPQLDGRHNKFIDLIHFSHEGEQLMAEIMFSGLRPVLEKDLGMSIRR